MRILVTGGAGFIGAHLVRRLLANGHELTVIDDFLPQVHPRGVDGYPQDLRRNVDLISGSIADMSVLRHPMQAAQCVVHLAAETGTGQSMYQIERYSRSNLTGTALILELLANGQASNVTRLVVASSRAIYGEGAYLCPEHGLVYPGPRSAERMRAHLFEPLCPRCGTTVSSTPTPESAPFSPSSFYGLTKQVQEQMFLLMGSTLGIPSVALRYQNVFGPGQALSNPYTGILAIFSNLARLNQPIRIFEDGLESRDFVHIDDVIEATCRAIELDLRGTYAVNVGSGTRTSVFDVAKKIVDFYASNSKLQVTREFRLGDIRHGCADLTQLQHILRYAPEWTFDSGLRSFLVWAEESAPTAEGYGRSLDEMRSRGLMGG